MALRWLAEQCTDVDVEMSPGMGRLRRKQVKSLTDAIMNMGNVRRRERALPLLADGFEGAVEGIGERCGQMPLIVYSVRKCLDILVSEGMSEVEAREYFDFNVGGAWMGEGTPIWVTGCDADGVEEYLDGLSICQEDTNPPA